MGPNGEEDATLLEEDGEVAQPVAKKLREAARRPGQKQSLERLDSNGVRALVWHFVVSRRRAGGGEEGNKEKKKSSTDSRFEPRANP